MATRDNSSNQIITEAFAPTLINQEAVYLGRTIDTANYEGGIKFGVKLENHSDGEFAARYEESDDPLMNSITFVPPEKIIGDPIVLTGDIDARDPWPSNGLFSTKRYVRVVLDTTGATILGNFTVIAVQAGEYNPQP